MKNRTTAIKLSLGALALWTGLAAQAAAPEVTDIAMVPRLTIQSDVGTTNQIQYCTNLSQGWWLALTNLVVAESPYWFVDVDAPPSPQRFYRARVVGPTPEGMALIPAGSFTMGNCMDPGEGEARELPLHTVYVSAFYMDQYEVTKALWDDVYNWAICHGYSFEYGAAGKASDHPALLMKWYDAVKWCNARSEKENKTPAYYTEAGLSVRYRSGEVDVQTNWVNWSSGYRLPTEAEWEKAARGGASGHRFPWSDADTINWSRANYYAWPSGYSYDVNPTGDYNPAGTNGGGPYTSPVGYFTPNGYGLYDMAGNVWEWCWDWYSDTYYTSSPGTHPRGPASGSARVGRGGGCYHSANFCRAADRFSRAPAYGSDSLGFRSVLPLGQ